MAITIQHSPAANLVGPVAQQAGQGMFQQRQQDRQQTQNNMLLQSQLADRQQRLGFALDSARLGQQMQAQQVAQQQDLVRMNFAANLQAQQQQFQQAMAVQQQQNDLAFRQAAGAQQLELQRQMGFAELDQNSQLMQLRNSTQANSAWQNLQAEQRALDEALSSNYITEDQHKALSYEHARKIAGFNPGQYALDGPYPQGQGMGDIWDETRSFPGVGDLTLKYSRDRNGVPQLTDDSKLYFEKVVVPQALQKMGIGTGKLQPGQTPEGVSFTDYAKMWDTVNSSLQSTDDLGNTIQADPKQVDAQLNSIYDSYQRRFGTPDPNATSPSPLMQQIMGGMMGGQQPMPQQPTAPRQRQSQQMAQAPSPLRQSFPNWSNDPPEQFATNVTFMYPDLVTNYLKKRYPDPRAEVVNQDDLAFFGALRERRLAPPPQQTPAPPQRGFQWMPPEMPFLPG